MRYTPETWPKEDIRPVLRKLFEVCEESGLSLYQLDKVAFAFGEIAKAQIRENMRLSAFTFQDVIDD